MTLFAEFDTGTLKTLDACPVCKSNANDSEDIAEDFIELFGERLFYSVNLCPQCGIIYSRTRSVEDRLYSPELDIEKEHGHQRPGLSPLSDDVWNLETKTLQVAEIIAAMPAKSPVRYLEVGASDGMLFRMIHQRSVGHDQGLLATLIESSGAANPCEEIEGCHVVSQSFLDDFDLHEELFDIVVLSHCLEHFDNPRDVVTKAYDLLVPGGILYVEVPDGMRYDRCISTPLGYFHVLNFNLLNLAWLVEDLGFDCTEQVEREHYPGIRVIARKSHKSKRIEISPRSLQLSQETINLWKQARVGAFDRLQNISVERTLVFGAGVHAIALFGQFPHWLGVCDLADSNTRLKQFMGHAVLSPDDLDFSAYDQVIVSSYAYQNAIVRQLRDAGCPQDKLVTLYDEIFTYVA